MLGGWGIGQVLAVDLATDTGTLVALAGGLIGSVILVGIADLVMPKQTEA